MTLHFLCFYLDQICWHSRKRLSGRHCYWWRILHRWKVSIAEQCGLKHVRYLSHCLSVYLTNGFHVGVRLLSNRSQITLKCGKNIISTLGYRLVCHFFVLFTFRRCLAVCLSVSYLSVCRSGAFVCLSFFVCARGFVCLSVCLFDCLSGPKVHSVCVRWFVRCWSLVWVKAFTIKNKMVVRGKSQTEALPSWPSSSEVNTEGRG